MASLVFSTLTSFAIFKCEKKRLQKIENLCQLKQHKHVVFDVTICKSFLAKYFCLLLHGLNKRF